jgi:hypothetical protein
MAEEPPPTTQQLSSDQVRRELAERRAAAGDDDPEATLAHTRRADQARYLRERLAEREDSEREDG